MDISMNGQVSGVRSDHAVHSAGKAAVLDAIPPVAKGGKKVAEAFAANRDQVAVNQPERLEQAVETVSSYLKVAATDLQLQVNDEAGGVTVVSVLDREDGKVIRQYPTEEMLDLAKRITQQMTEFREALVHGGSMVSQGVFTNTVA